MILQTKIIKNTKQTSGMSKLTNFLKMDISLPFKLKRRKLATSKQKKIITLFNNLFSSGFHLVEIISFLDRSLLLEKEYVSQMRLGLSKGKSFSEMMGNLGFSSAIVTQLSLAEVAYQLKEILG